MMLVLFAVVPWAFRDGKAFQGVDQQAGEARCSLAIALGPSFLSHLKNKGMVKSWHNYLRYTKGVDDFYLWPHGGVQLHGYMIIIRAKILAWRQLLLWGFFLNSKGALLQN